MNFTLSPITINDVSKLHQLYLGTPSYFHLLGSKVPELSEVERDVETALYDRRRKIELIYDEYGELIGSLDYKLDYPEEGDLTINLLMIREDRQSQGLGEQVVCHLENNLPCHITRVLASVLGDNVRGARFWQRLGYHFELDARPIMAWYAKFISPPILNDISSMSVAGD